MSEILPGQIAVLRLRPALLQIGKARRLSEIGFGCLARGAGLRLHVGISAAAPGRDSIHTLIPLAITKAPCELQFARGHGVICKPNYRLEERTPQAGNSGGTQKTAERHPRLFSADAPLLPKLGYSPLPRIARAKPAIDEKNLPKQLAEFFATGMRTNSASFRAGPLGFLEWRTLAPRRFRPLSSRRTAIVPRSGSAHEGSECGQHRHGGRGFTPRELQPEDDRTNRGRYRTAP